MARARKALNLFTTSLTPSHSPRSSVSWKVLFNSSLLAMGEKLAVFGIWSHPNADMQASIPSPISSPISAESPSQNASRAGNVTFDAGVVAKMFHSWTSLVFLQYVGYGG